MKIIIEMFTSEGCRWVWEDIRDVYSAKIAGISKCRNEIFFKNGDSIKLISMQSRCVDGYRADVAIGPRAREFTCSSDYPKRVWDLHDLSRYLDSM